MSNLASLCPYCREMHLTDQPHDCPMKPVSAYQPRYPNLTPPKPKPVIKPKGKGNRNENV